MFCFNLFIDWCWSLFVCLMIKWKESLNSIIDSIVINNVSWGIMFESSKECNFVGLCCIIFGLLLLSGFYYYILL